MDGCDVLYVWQAFENGRWGTLAAHITELFPGTLPDELETLLGSGTVLLVSPLQQVSHLFGLFAVKHHDATGLPVRRARYVLDEVEREMP